MKRITLKTATALLTLLLMAPCAEMLQAQQPQSITKGGDANCDDVVNVLDVISIVNYIMQNNPQPFCFDNANVNADGVISVLDIIALVNVIMQTPGIPCPSIPSVTDADGNRYATVLIGTQCWMKENLKTTKYRNGTAIEYPGTNNAAWEANTSGAYAWYNNDAAWKPLYGALYNWHAVNNANGLCPSGWHVPSQNEWIALTNYIGGTDSPNGNKLKSCRQVSSPLGGVCNTSEHPRWDQHGSNHGTDDYGFSGLPGGIRRNDGLFFHIGGDGYWWSSTEYVSSTTWSRALYATEGAVDVNYDDKQGGLSVRCLRDATGQVSLPSVQTSPATNITSSTASVGGDVVNDGGSPVIERGVKVSTSPNPAVSGTATPSGIGTGIFSVELTGLMSNTAYYYVAYATNVVGTAYGQVGGFTTTSGIWPPGTVHCSGTPTAVVDVTNPTTGKTWMDRNLGASRVATSSTDAQAYGDLYQWGRAADGHQCRNSPTTTALSSSDTPGHGSFILPPNYPYDWRSPQNNNLWQGANGTNNPCPSGYRLPTRAELDAERLSWSSNNSAGAYNSPLKLSVAGDRVSLNGSLSNVGSGGNYWSGTVDGFLSRHLNFNFTVASMYGSSRANGYSVRCLKDEPVQVSLPSVQTTPATNITSSTAWIGGNVVDDGGSHVTERGVKVSTSPDPASSGAATPSGNGPGIYSIELIGLTPNTPYYYVAYATNAVGTSYGSVQEFSTLPAGSAPVAAFTGNPTSGTAPLVVSFTDQSTNNPTSWLWEFGDGTTSTQQNPSKTYSTAGTYTVRLTATNSFGSNAHTKTNYITVTSGGGTWPPGTVHCSGTPTAVVDVTNPTTGKTWMDRNLGASRVATSSTDAQAYGDLYQWGRAADGHQCLNSPTTTTLSSSDTPGHGSFILAPNYPYDWRSPQNNNFWQGVSGTNNPCPSGYRLPTHAELDAERLSWSSNNSAGAFNSPLKLSVAGVRMYNGGFLDGVGSSGDYWSSTVGGVYSRNLGVYSGNAFMTNNTRARGLSVRCLKDEFIQVNLPSVQTTPATNITSSTAWIGGNVVDDGGSHVTERGVKVSTSPDPAVSGTATPSGIGTGIFSVELTGLMSNTAYYYVAYATNAVGTAYGQVGGFTTTSEIWPPGTVHCSGTPTAVVDVTNPTTGKTWMDRNLGASRVATNSTDAQAYGDLYQWGRAADGHQCLNSPTTTTLSSSDIPGHGSFILAPNDPRDWRSPQNDNLWQGVNGNNNPCPTGYRLPTEAELNSERSSWSSQNSAGAFNSPLKLSVAGGRYNLNGSLIYVGSNGNYWSSTVGGIGSRNLGFGSSNASVYNIHRAYGLSVRCIKE